MSGFHCTLRLLAAGWILPAGLALAEPWQVEPRSVLLNGPEASQQLLVTEALADGRSIDRTRTVRWELADPAVATITARGLVQPRSEGITEIIARGEETELRIRLEVRGLERPEPVSFRDDVIPILTKARCNSGSCHGKAEGQNGFRLSVFGHDPRADHDQIAKEAGQRRVSPTVPDQSLLLRKATAQVPHGGGRKIEPGSLRHQRLRRWIAEGARIAESVATVSELIVSPGVPNLASGGSQQILVTAVLSDGRRRCVTSEAEYESSAEPVARVDDQGLVTAGDVPGEAIILVRYMGQVGVSRVVHPRTGTDFTRPEEVSPVDRFVWNKLEELGIQPSERCDDATFLRRAFLDVIGTLPTVDEAADYWTQRWSDILRVDREKMTPAGAVAVTRWLRRQFAENRPYDEFVREIVTAQGDTLAESPAALYRVFETPEDASRSMSQLFLGVRIECAQCHHHPAEKWGQEDYFALAGFFTSVGRKSLATGSTAVVVKGGEDLKHPRTGQTVPARALGAAPADFSRALDRRRILADWMTRPDNPYVARTLVNRLWAHYLGRGLVEPVDDLRATNPASNEPLFAYLADQFREARYDVHALTRLILNSGVYQRSAATNESNALDERDFSHARRKPLPAEVLLDAISQATGVPEKFPGWPEGYRAIQVWDNRLESYFFRVFGRPVRASVCECERSSEPSIAQALHLLNSPEIAERIESSRGRARLLSESERGPGEIVEELYLATLSRLPTEEERRLSLGEFERSDRRRASEDILWALINSKEFLDNH